MLVTELQSRGRSRKDFWPDARLAPRAVEQKGRKKGQQRWGCCSISSTRTGAASNWDLLSQSGFRIAALFFVSREGKKPVV